ncbi:MAG: phage minor head protein [Vicinamibacterales bacterium]
MPTLLGQVEGLQREIRKNLRAAYGTLFEREAGLRHVDGAEVRDVIGKVVRPMSRLMMAADIAGRVDTSRKLRDGGLRRTLRLVELPMEKAAMYLEGLTPSDVPIDVDDIAAVYSAQEFRLTGDIGADVAHAVRDQFVRIFRDGGGQDAFIAWARDLEKGYVSDSHSESLWRTWSKVATTAGRLRQLNDDPDLRGWAAALGYVAVGGHSGDGRNRPNHLLLDGFTAEVTHEAWGIVTPPNGWMCRCRIHVLSWAWAKRNDRVGLDGEFKSDSWPITRTMVFNGKVYTAGADPGWEGSPVGDIYG